VASKKRPAPRGAPAFDPAQMLVFAALAREGGVRGAAASLGVPRSTVSRRLAQLEEAAGAALVVRTSRRFALTEVGRAFAERCAQLEALLVESEAVVRRASDEPSGTLRIAAAPVLGEEILPRIVSELLARYPRLSVDVRLSVEYVDLRRGADVVLRAHALDDATDVYAQRLGASVTGCYVGPAYVASRGVPASPEEMADHDAILVGAPPRTWTFTDPRGRAVEVPIAGRVRVDNYRLARDLAASGAGILRIARVFADPLVASGALVPVLERFWPETPIYAAHAGPNPPPAKVRAFLELARAAVTDALRPHRPRWRTA